MNQELFQRIVDQVGERLRERGDSMHAFSREDRRAIGAMILSEVLEDYAKDCIEHGRAVLDEDEEVALTKRVLDHFFAAGTLQDLLEDPDVMEINAAGCDDVWIRRRSGPPEQGPAIASSDIDLIDLINGLARHDMHERRFDTAHPYLNLHLPNGDRLFAVMDVCKRPVLCIRRHDFTTLARLDQQVETGMLDADFANFERAAVHARKNIIVCGSTGAGKTTHIRALANEVPPDERIVTIEDALELGLDRFRDLHPQVIALQEREANVEGRGAIPMVTLTKWALRANPDRVILGEVRGDEVIPMLAAMNQGTDGSMCTVHASSARAAFSKLSTYATMAPERLSLEESSLLIANGVHFVVHIALKRTTRSLEAPQRFVTSLVEVVGVNGVTVTVNDVFEPGADGRARPSVRPQCFDELVEAGLDPTIFSGSN